MIQKRFAIVMILLANISLLAHVVIPHHHHRSEICFAFSELEHPDSLDCRKALTDHHLHHDGKDDDGYCLLREIVSYTQKSIRLAAPVSRYDSMSLPFLWVASLQSILDDQRHIGSSTLELYGDPPNRIQNRPLKTSQLRAPPIV